MIVRKGRHDLLFAKSESAVEQILFKKKEVVFIYSILCYLFPQVDQEGKLNPRSDHIIIFLLEMFMTQQTLYAARSESRLK